MALKWCPAVIGLHRNTQYICWYFGIHLKLTSELWGSQILSFLLCISVLTLRKYCKDYYCFLKISTQMDFWYNYVDIMKSKWINASVRTIRAGNDSTYAMYRYPKSKAIHSLWSWEWCIGILHRPTEYWGDHSMDYVELCLCLREQRVPVVFQPIPTMSNPI